jgi:maleylpyruvate isomerase
MTDDQRRLDREVAGAAAAHQRLLVHLDERDPVAPDRPSRLPGWTVGHVLTHLARNADSFVRMFEGAERGDVVEQYVGGIEGRKADIEEGSTRPWGELIDDVRRSIWTLEQTWAHHSRWDGEGRSVRRGLVPVVDLPFGRWRETEVHHVDLGLGYTLHDWPDDYVREDLRRMEIQWNARRPMGMTGLPPAALQAPPHERLAWLLGRSELDDLPPADIFG